MLEYNICGNAPLCVDGSTLLQNIRRVQELSNIPCSTELSKELGAVSLDIDMETGTGKTYVYIKTMFELHKHYGWNKYIIVVPSIAIREGVAKSFRMLEEHFMELYGHKARYNVYDSKNLNHLESFASDMSLSVLIINIQAFNTSLKEGGSSKESRIIYSKQDRFGSRRPIDVLAATRPILIIDEPQKAGGEATQKSLKHFDALFVLNYSATHKTHHNTVYSLDALDAYQQKLVKRIEVTGFELKNLQSQESYLYLDSFVLSPNRPPQARIEVEVKQNSGNKRSIKLFAVGDKLEELTHLACYKGFVITEINPAKECVVFENGTILHSGEVLNDATELSLQRLQIRETIKRHIEKEENLYNKGIKCLSLFFIDEVAKYRQYDAEGNALKGELQKIFEEEYSNYLHNNPLKVKSEAYKKYLYQFTAEEVQKGYFSIDKNNRIVNAKTDKEGQSTDTNAYDLILKNKERLLSFEEPTRFIFSHSALREGWDNPNVFQICTLRHSQSQVAKRQEVGRGLRLCVNKEGIRMDSEMLGNSVHEVNLLTVITNESYTRFTEDLQKDISTVLRVRPTKASVKYFTENSVTVDGETHKFEETDASRIIIYLEDNGYIAPDGALTQLFRDEKAKGALKPIPAKLQPHSKFVFKLLDSLLDPSQVKDMVKPTSQRIQNELNENFKKEEFQSLWKEINHKYVYRVHYDSEKLIDEIIKEINNSLQVRELGYRKMVGSQLSNDNTQFGNVRSEDGSLSYTPHSNVKYDLVGCIAQGAKLTRRTVVKVLQGILPERFNLFRINPEEFISKVITIACNKKSVAVIENIEYNITGGNYGNDIFTEQRNPLSKLYPTKKNITNYLFPDSDIEKSFAQSMDEGSEVVVYAKLPKSFQIPTPVGNYAPDWAIAMQKDNVKHIFFVAETKGTTDAEDLRTVERSKIACAEKLYNNLNSGKAPGERKVTYRHLSDYDDLIEAMNSVL